MAGLLYALMSLMYTCCHADVWSLAGLAIVRRLRSPHPLLLCMKKLQHLAGHGRCNMEHLARLHHGQQLATAPRLQQQPKQHQRVQWRLQTIWALLPCLT